MLRSPDVELNDYFLKISVEKNIHLEPATSYEFRVRGFTTKREGGDSAPLTLNTDTANPSQPVISVLNCTGTVAWLYIWGFCLQSSFLAFGEKILNEHESTYLQNFFLSLMKLKSKKDYKRQIFFV